MEKLSSQDMRDILLVGAGVLDCHQVDDLRATTLSHLEKTFSSESGNFFIDRESSGELDLDRVVSLGIGSGYLKKFREYYHSLDPFMAAYPSQDKVLTMEQVTSYCSLLESEYYNDFLSPQSIHHEMVIRLRSGARLLGQVAIFRPSKRPDYSAREIAKAKLLAPYLSAALEKALVSAQFKVQQSIASFVAQDLAHRGVIVLDDSMETIFHNHKASEVMAFYLQEKGPWGESGPPLPDEVRRCCLEFREAARKKSAPETERRILSLSGQTEGPNLKVQLRRLDHLEESPLLLVLMEFDELAATSSARLKGKGVSRRETEVIDLLCQGLTNVEIAERLFISQYTVESHITSIYRKMGVKNRASLIHQLVSPTPL